jgi:hypothetical protein
MIRAPLPTHHPQQRTRDLLLSNTVRVHRKLGK